MVEGLVVGLTGGGRLARDCPKWVLALLDGSRDEIALADHIWTTRRLAGLKVFYRSLARLRADQRVQYILKVSRDRMASWIPRGPDQIVWKAAASAAGRVPARTRVQLSRFTYIRRANKRIVIESPQVLGRIVVDDPRMLAIIGRLDRPCAMAALAAAVDLPAHVTQQFVALLLAHGFAFSAGGAVREGAAGSWEFHDLLFHARSRHGRHLGAYGAHGGQSRGRSMPLPAASAIVTLPAPDRSRIQAGDLSLTEAIERRASVRRYGARPLTIAELGEFLYRTARARRGRLTVAGRPVVDRLAPTGGAAYELEVNVAVQRCRGLRAGLYRYDPVGHALWRRAPDNHDVRGLIASAGFAARARPPLVLIISARFARTLDRYASMAYAMILKDVGVLFQTFYLVAASMQLAPCAIGGGDADDFARAAGTSYLEETSVGEFLLGPMRRSRSTPAGVPRPVQGFHPRRPAR